VTPMPHSEAVDSRAPDDHYGHMVVTSIASLKASLGEFLAGVKAGEEVVVTDRGRPVARIVPYDPGGDVLDGLVRTGRVRRSRSPLPPDFLTRPRPADRHGHLLRALLDEREADR